VIYLVSGASGFIGWHLVARLADEGHHVTAWVRSGINSWPGRSVVVDRVDVTGATAVSEGLAAAAPGVVFHLAAQSFPMRSWSEPVATLRTNVEGTVNLLEALRRNDTRRPRILMAGSSSQYAASMSGGPIGEDAPVAASSPYAVSKLAADHLADLYGRAFGLDVVRFRPFFWIGSHKTGDVASDIARRIVAIERGAPPRLKIGRTDTVRDMIDVEDGIAALLLLAERGTTGVAYNVCCGRGTSIAQLIAQFRAHTRVPFEVEPDATLLRATDEPVKIGDPARILALGWRPRKTLEQSTAAILDYWRGQ
jgi:GDP-4-dehydro-6-deoxy-D-mannose reductase